MQKLFIEDKLFDRIDYSSAPLNFAEYEKCKFMNCNFSACDLSNFNFTDCVFSGCNLSLTKINKTSFRDVIFKDCKLVGLQFFNCNSFMFSVSFESCILTLASFYKLNLKKKSFKDCNLQEADFTEADLGAALFDNCDLRHAIFRDTSLEKTNFISSFNYSIDPSKNKVKKAKFSLAGIPGLLDTYDIEIVVT